MRVESHTHDTVRHGTTTLFAALDVATGNVIGKCKKRRRPLARVFKGDFKAHLKRRPRRQGFLSFLRHIDASVPKALDVHLIVDNHATHKHAKVKRWLAARPRCHVHFTPTYSSWLNQVEIWFNIITRRAIRRGSFKSVRDLTGC